MPSVSYWDHLMCLVNNIARAIFTKLHRNVSRVTPTKIAKSNNVAPGSGV